MEGYISDSLYTNNRKRNNSLINRRIILRVLGVLLLVEVCMLLTCVGVAWFYNESDGWAFLLSAGITALINDKPLQEHIVEYLGCHDYGNEGEVNKSYKLLD